MAFTAITFDIQADVAVLTLNRPERMNALNSRMRAEITKAVAEAGTHARVLVMTGAGSAFCSGQDLSDVTRAEDLDVEMVLRDEYMPMLQAIVNCPIPTIAAVNGAAAGAGANLALAADVVIAAQQAVFVQAFTRIGLIPDAGGTYSLPRQIGLARAMGACLFADSISAQQAAEWGMIYEVVANKGFTAHWQKRASQLATGPTQAYTHLKTALRASFENNLDEQLALEAELQGKCGETADFREGVAAFLEKRTAVFSGK